MDIFDIVLEEFEVNSEEELLNKYGTKDFYEKAKDGVFSYAELVCVGLLDEDDLVETLGIEKSLSEGIISQEEAEDCKDLIKNGLFEGFNLEKL